MKADTLWRLQMNDTKICSRCGIERTLTEFHLRKISLDGRRGICRWCERKRRAGRQKYVPRLKVAIKNSFKLQVNQQLRDAVQQGQIVKSVNCDMCQKPPIKRSLAGHHVDYAKPLKVIWLCQSCHSLAHMV